MLLQTRQSQLVHECRSHMSACSFADSKFLVARQAGAAWRAVSTACHVDIEARGRCVGQTRGTVQLVAGLA